MSATEDSMAPPSFNPMNQIFVLYFPDGTNTSFTFYDLDDFRVSAIQTCIGFGTQIGAAIIVLFAMMFLSKPEKFRTVLLWLNAFILVLLTIRNVLQITYFVGPFYRTYTLISTDASDIPASAIAQSATTSCLSMILIACVQISLTMQVRVVCASHPTLNLYVMMASIFVGLISTGFYFAFGILNVRATLDLKVSNLPWLFPVADALFAFSICFYCAIFVVKLWFAICRRRSLGLVGFGPLQVIFTMGCQTLTLPAIFLMIENFVTFNGLASFAEFLIAISLPLSSLWAATKSGSETPSGVDCRRFLVKKSTSSPSSSLASTSGSSHTGKRFGVFHPSGLSKVGKDIYSTMEKAIDSAKSFV